MSKGNRIPLADAERIANEFCNTYLTGQYVICGSIRRKKPDVGDIDLMTTDKLEDIKTRGAEVIDGGDARINVKFKDMVFNIYHYELEYFGATEFFLTGPHHYNIGMRVRAKKMGYTLNQYGIFKGEQCLASKTEEEIFKVLDKPYKEPELRGVK
jgi:DNA polymerase (family 10)